MVLCGCETPQGQSWMANFFSDKYTLHGDTHLQTLKKYSAEMILAVFDQLIENLLNTVNYLQILQPPVMAAIDIITWPYHAVDSFIASRRLPVLTE